jgi:hypothetical protein
MQHYEMSYGCVIAATGAPRAGTASCGARVLKTGSPPSMSPPTPSWANLQKNSKDVTFATSQTGVNVVSSCCGLFQSLGHFCVLRLFMKHIVVLSDGTGNAASSVWRTESVRVEPIWSAIWGTRDRFGTPECIDFDRVFRWWTLMAKPNRRRAADALASSGDRRPK